MSGGKKRKAEDSIMECVCCHKDKAPYRCPKCIAKYCSVACYKIHKESCSSSIDDQGAQLNGQESTQTVLAENATQHTLIDTEILSEESKIHLRSSKWLKDILKSNRLREQILAIDKGKDRLKALKAVRKSNTEFDIFVSKMLHELSTKKL